MQKRTTIIADRAVIDFLHSQKYNVSEICNKALYKFATEFGYLDIDGEIDKMTKALNRLKRIKGKKHSKEILEWQFATLFKRYLSDSPKPHAQMREWLKGPGMKEYGSIVGHPSNLTDIKMNELVALAMASPRILPEEIQ